MKRVFRFLFILLLILSWVIKEFVSDVPADAVVEQSPSCNEYSETDSLQTSTTHHRSWQEYTWNDNFCTSYMIGSEQAILAEQFRTRLTVDETLDDNRFWREIYHRLYLDTHDRLHLLQDSLILIGMDQQLDRGELARMVVALVQDIPYQYILPEGCDGHDSAPCQPNVRFGIYSPLEFLYTMKGDCDTRTVLLYTLLKDMGYDPLIINSEEYAHSMLALDVPASGDDFLYNGRRYAYWETTNTGWLPGMLPPGMNNKEYWTIALDYEYENQPVGNY